MNEKWPPPSLREMSDEELRLYREDDARDAKTFNRLLATLLIVLLLGCGFGAWWSW